MARTEEQVLAKLAANIAALADASTEFHRNPAAPIPGEAGKRYIILADGDPGEPEEELGLGGVGYTYEHEAGLGLGVVAGPGEDPDVIHDQLVTDVRQVLAADPDLGGLCEYTEARAPAEPETTLINAEGPMKSRLVTVICVYETTDALA